MLAQQTIPASKDARDAPPMAPDADIPFVPWAHLAALNATIASRATERLALDDVMLADLDCQPDNATLAVIVEHLVIPVESSPAGIVVTARRLRGRGSSWE
jgi:hypothetical protein